MTTIGRGPTPRNTSRPRERPRPRASQAENPAGEAPTRSGPNAVGTVSTSEGAVPGSDVYFAVKVLGESRLRAGFDEGVLEVEYGRAREAPPDERGGNS
jgi:hypothetical protein